MMNLLYYSLSFYLALQSVRADPIAAVAAPAPAPTTSAPPKPCTTRSAKSGQFFDLNPLHVIQSGKASTKAEAKHVRDYSWNTTGIDYPYNFTMNFCGPVVEDIKDVVGVKESSWRNVSAYYTLHDKTYSIGMQNSWPVLRGRKLVLNFTDGSPCGPGSSKRDLEERDVEERAKGIYAADDELPVRRKNTIISLLCDRDPASPALTLNFVGADPDECSYFFEARSSAACGTIDVAKQTIGPGGVFGVIVLIAVIVYLVGGCVYSRTVLQQRGWRQCPNYNLWAGAFSFLGDLFIILTSSCSRCLPGRRGYSRVNANGNGNGNGRTRGRDSDAENRLIDELNEEWDD